MSTEKRFSVVEMIAGALPGHDSYSTELARQWGAQSRSATQMSGVERPIGEGAVFLPYSAFQRGEKRENAVTTTTGPSVPVIPAAPQDLFIPVLRNQTVLGRAGARIIQVPGFQAGFVRQDGAAAATWITENPGSDTSESDFATQLLTMTMRTLAAHTSVSAQNLNAALSGRVDLMEIIERDLAATFGLAIDLAGVQGDGVNQPLGLLNNTAIDVVSLGTNGGHFDRPTACTLEDKLADNNADHGDVPPAWVTNNKVRKWARQQQDFTGSSKPLWTNANKVISYPATSSKQVPNNLTKGTSTTVCSAIIFGAFEQQLVGLFGGGMDLVIDPYTKKFQGMVEISAFVYADILCARTTAFEIVKDALTT